MRALCASLLFVSAFILPAAAQQVAAAPWTSAILEVGATETDFQKSGILAIKSHVDALEAALRDATAAFSFSSRSADGTVTVLTDGPAETIAATAVASEKGSQHVVAVANPYPRIGLYLGSYYNETGHYDDALRVLDVGLKSSPNDMRLGATLPVLYSEKAAALEELHRWDDGLAACEAGLALPQVRDYDKARLYRCRGYNLIELKRLDEAEASYQDSLKLDPGSQLAQSELNCIAALRSAKSCTAGATLLLTPPPPANPPVTPQTDDAKKPI